MTDGAPAPAPARTGRFRWVICGLLFFATTINYVDRGVLGVLAPTLQQTIGWSDAQYGDINAAFTLAYALGFVVMGWLMDRLGVRLGYAVALVFWSVAAAAHALASTAFGFGAARFFLGLGEAGNFPAAIKTTAQWFPRQERALATGVFNAGSNVGVIVAPILVPWLTLRWGWQTAFVATGLIGLLWLAFWLPLYRRPEDHPAVGPAELAYIQAEREPIAAPVRWRHLLPHRQTWAFSMGKFLTDPIWWFYLFWSAKFFNEKFGVDLKHIGPPLVTIYLLADVGSVAGGWFSSRLLRRGWTANAARKTAMLACALCILPVVYAPVTPHLWVAVALIGVAAAAHQGFSANLFTLTSDMFPQRAVGSVVGLGGMAGALGGFLMQLGAGRIKELTGSYFSMFVLAGTLYLGALLVVHLFAPRLEPAQLSRAHPDA